MNYVNNEISNDSRFMAKKVGVCLYIRESLIIYLKTYNANIKLSSFLKKRYSGNIEILSDENEIYQLFL